MESSSPSEQGFAEDLWKQIIEIEMQLSQHPYVVARMPINRDYGFHANLEVFTRPDHARVYGPSGWRPTPVKRCFHGELHQRDEAVKGCPQPDVFHVALQINKAVL